MKIQADVYQEMIDEREAHNKEMLQLIDHYKNEIDTIQKVIDINNKNIASLKVRKQAVS